MTKKQMAEQLRLALNSIARGMPNKAYERIKPIYEELLRLMELERNDVSTKG